MDAYTPDLSGEALEYYVNTYQRTIFKAYQKVLFSVPIYYNSKLEVVLLGTINTVLVEGVDYLIGSADYADDAMSVCKSIDPSFDKILIHSLTIIRPYSDYYRIQIKFNQLFADQINYARINQDQQIEVTPTLIGNMIAQIDYLQQMVLNPSTIFSPQSAEVKILDVDLSGVNLDNQIIDEKHDVNTLIRIDSIRPIYGAFFRGSVTVKNGLSGELFESGSDYEIIEVDLAKTRITPNPHGVYRTIRILKEFVGEIKVTYQAFGGSTDVISMKRITDRLITLEDYLSSTSYITPNTLPADPAIIAMNNKIKEMESTMRLLLQNGLPSYGDVSTGSAVVKKIVATDNLPHWWSIATLYRVNGSVDNIMADVFKFRIKSLMSNLMFECAVSVNVTGQLDDVFDIKCLSSLLPENTLEKYTPRLRIIRVTTPGVYSGVILQLGLRLGESILQDTFAIEDMSGKESCWKLVAFDPNSTPPEDTGVLMPDGVSVFTYGSTDSLSIENDIPFDRLNILYPNSNIPVVLGGDGTIEYDSVVQALSYLNFDNIKSITNLITVNIGSTPYDIKVVVPVTFCDTSARVITGSTNFTLGEDSYSLIVSIYFDIATSAYVINYSIIGNPVNTFNVKTTQINM